MREIQAIFFGAARSGKTQLVNGIANAKFSNTYRPTFAVDLSTIKKHDVKYNLWDLSAENDDHIKQQLYLKQHIGFYCVDLSQLEFDYKKIIAEITEFKKTTTAPVVLVGTKADELSSFDHAEQKLNALHEKLKEHVELASVCCTSSKLIHNLDKLSGLMQDLTSKEENEQDFQEVVIKSPWEEALIPVYEQIKLLPNHKSGAMQMHIEDLKRDLTNKEIACEIAVAGFMEQCTRTLEGKHPVLMNSVLTLAAVAAVTVVAALIGFGIGFALGCWSGPGAFFTALVGGAAAATAVIAVSGSLGLVAGGLTAHGLFKSSAQEKVVVDFVEKVQTGLKP